MIRSGFTQADLFDGMRHDPKSAPAGYFAVPKEEAKPKDGSNICRACDWRQECQKPTTDFTRREHRCMPWARDDGSSVLFKRFDQFHGAAPISSRGSRASVS